MRTTPHSAQTTAAPEAAWATLPAPHSGTSLRPGSATFEPHGPFDVGTTGTSVSHTLAITGPIADEAEPELGPRITGDFKVAIAELLSAVERRTAGTPS